MRRLETENSIKPIIDAIPLIALIIDNKGRLYLINQVTHDFLTSIAKSHDYRNKFGGEVFGCVHAQEDPYGCTFGPNCNDCKLFLIAMGAIKGKTTTNAKCEFFSKSSIGVITLSLLVNAAPIQLFGETFAFIVIKDITASEKLEAELLKKEKLEALGILSGGIAHDFNNTLMSLLANVQLALFKLDKGLNVKKHLLDSIDMIYNASNLSKQLLNFSKGGSPVKTDTPLTRLIKDNVKFVLQGSNIDCRFIIDPNLAPVAIDPGQISQVIINLIINAKQAMAEGGFINVTAKNISLTGNNYRPGNYVMISVQDYGIGIPEENLGKIFDPFFTTKPEGNGLGLATSYSIIQNHGGYLEVDSNEGTGSIFTIYLPATVSGQIDSEPHQSTISGE